jgi:hypothetical protein
VTTYVVTAKGVKDGDPEFVVHVGDVSLLQKMLKSTRRPGEPAWVFVHAIAADGAMHAVTVEHVGGGYRTVWREAHLRQLYGAWIDNWTEA